MFLRNFKQINFLNFNNLKKYFPSNDAFFMQWTALGLHNANDWSVWQLLVWKKNVRGRWPSV